MWEEKPAYRGVDIATIQIMYEAVVKRGIDLSSDSVKAFEQGLELGISVARENIEASQKEIVERMFTEVRPKPIKLSCGDCHEVDRFGHCRATKKYVVGFFETDKVPSDCPFSQHLKNLEKIRRNV